MLDQILKGMVMRSLGIVASLGLMALLGLVGCGENPLPGLQADYAELRKVDLTDAGISSLSVEGFTQRTGDAAAGFRAVAEGAEAAGDACLTRKAGAYASVLEGMSRWSAAEDDWFVLNTIFASDAELAEVRGSLEGCPLDYGEAGAIVNFEVSRLYDTEARMDLAAFRALLSEMEFGDDIVAGCTFASGMVMEAYAVPWRERAYLRKFKIQGTPPECDAELSEAVGFQPGNNAMVMSETFEADLKASILAGVQPVDGLWMDPGKESAFQE